MFVAQTLEKKCRLLILKTNLVAWCSRNSDLGRAQKRLGTADLAILALAAEDFFKTH